VPSDPHPSPGGHQRGWRGEARLQRDLRRAQDANLISAFLQPEAVVVPVAGYPFMVEAKDQEHFEAPPFDGHGLPVWQAMRYEQVRLATRMRTVLTVYEGDVRYKAWLDELEAGDHFDTAGTVKWPRRVYPLTGFRRSHA
jgi:hypothetical protein